MGNDPRRVRETGCLRVNTTDFDLAHASSNQQKDHAQAKEALEGGYGLVEGSISYEDTESQLADLLGKMLKILGEDENYCVVNDDLSY